MQERIPSKKIATMPSGDPVRLDQAAEWAGQFWRPDQPDNVESGRLRYDPEDGLHLDLVSGARFPDLHDEFPWILGQTVDGRLVTLRDSFITNWSLHIPAGRQAELKANGAFFGLHATSDRELSFHFLEARMANLREWLGITGIGTPTFVKDAGSVAYRTPTPTPLAKSGGRSLTAHHPFIGGASPAQRPFSFSIEQQAWIRVEHARQRTFQNLFQLLGRFSALLAFATSIDAPLLEVRGETTVRRRDFKNRTSEERVPVWVLFSRATTRADVVRRDLMTFRMSDAHAVGLRPIARWFRRASTMEPVYNLYLSALPARQLQAEYRFLALAQALETFHARKRPRPRDVAYIQRIQNLVDTMPARLRKRVPTNFAERVRDTRNYYTHWSQRLEKRAAQEVDLYYLTSGARLLLDVTLLMELGFNKTQCTRLVERNDRLSKVLRAFDSI